MNWRAVGVMTGVAASFLAGWILRPLMSPATPKPTRQTQPLRTASSRSPEVPASPSESICPPCDNDALTECRNTLDATEAFVEMQERERLGQPTPFPDELPEAFRPETFEANVEQAVEACGVSPPEMVECTEYPCYVVFAGLESRNQLKSCEWWNARYPQPGITYASGSIFTESGQRHYELIGEWAPGVPIPMGSDNYGKRFQHRREELRLELMGQWDGYEPSEEEERAAQLAFWQKLADRGDESAAKMIEMLQSRD